MGVGGPHVYGVPKISTPVTLTLYYKIFLKMDITADGSNQRIVADTLLINNVNLVSQYRVYDAVQRFLCSIIKIYTVEPLY